MIDEFNTPSSFWSLRDQIKNSHADLQTGLFADLIAEYAWSGPRVRSHIIHVDKHNHDPTCIVYFQSNDKMEWLFEIETDDAWPRGTVWFHLDHPWYTSNRQKMFNGFVRVRTANGFVELIHQRLGSPSKRKVCWHASNAKLGFSIDLNIRSDDENDSKRYAKISSLSRQAMEDLPSWRRPYHLFDESELTHLSRRDLDKLKWQKPA